MNGATPDLALVALLLIGGGFVLERALLTWRWTPYFSLGFPLAPALVPIPELPEGAGRTALVRWEIEGDLARWWAEPGARGAPMGLRGVVRFARHRGGGFAMDVRWAPPWSPLLAAGWFAGLGTARGDGPIVIVLAAALVGVVLWIYWQAAIRAAAELRWAWVKQVTPT